LPDLAFLASLREECLFAARSVFDVVFLVPFVLALALACNGAENAGGADGETRDAGTTDDTGIDTNLVPPRTDGRVILAAITGYEMTNHCQEADNEAKCELPLFDPYNRDTIEWWYNLVEELAFSRVQLVLLHGRGCWDPSAGDEGSGNMCPRLLHHFVKAVFDKGFENVIRVGMFDDTGAYPFARNHVEGLPDGTPFDLADRSSWRFFWDHNMKPWFDTIPREMLLLVDGRPVVTFWSLAGAFFSNQHGNASELLKWLRQKMIDTYGLDPIFNVDTTWTSEDPTITASVAQGVNDWFGPPGTSYTVRNWGGGKWGCLVPGYRNANTLPGCGAPCREIPREDGGVLSRGLAANGNSAILLLEGFTNIAESVGFYRSDQWAIPNRYLNILREAADFENETLRYEAEAADACHDTTPGNTGGRYRLKGNLDIGLLPEGTGWFVGWTGWNFRTSSFRAARTGFSRAYRRMRAARKSGWRLTGVRWAPSRYLPRGDGIRTACSISALKRSRPAGTRSALCLKTVGVTWTGSSTGRWAAFAGDGNPVGKG
jgi:hypothetical protein